MKHKHKSTNTQEEAPRRLLDLNSAACYLSISFWSVRTLLDNGQLPFVRIGRRVLVDRQDLDAWIDRNKRREETY